MVTDNIFLSLLLAFIFWMLGTFDWILNTRYFMLIVEINSISLSGIKLFFGTQLSYVERG